MKKSIFVCFFCFGIFSITIGQNTDDALFASNNPMNTADEAANDNEVSNTFNPTSITSAQAAFPGGTSALMQYLADEITFPESAREQGDEGSVYVQFVVTPEGDITDAKVVKSVSAALDAEALRAIQAMPNWAPAYYNGRAVKSKVTVPVRYSFW